MKLLFDHTAKCGGTTVLRYLQRKYPSTFIINGFNTWHSLEHCPRDVECVAGHDAHYLKDVVIADVTATLLRDPIERVVSLYWYFKQEMIIEPDWSVEDFIQRSHGAINYYAYKFSGLPPHLYSHCPQLAIDRAVQAILSYNVVGFTDDMPSFLDQISIGGETIKRFNETQFKGELTLQDLEKIRQNNILDIQIFERVRREQMRQPVIN